MFSSFQALHCVGVDVVVGVGVVVVVGVGLNSKFWAHIRFFWKLLLSFLARYASKIFKALKNC